MSDLQLGQDVISYFNKYMNKYYGKTFTADELANVNSNMVGKTDVYVEGLGIQYDFTLNQDSGDLDDAMDSLARASGGKIPTSASFANAMSGLATSTFSFQELQQNSNNAVVSTLAGSIDSILNGFQSLGDTELNAATNAKDAVNTTFGLLKYAVPVLVVGGLVLYVWLNVESAPRLPKVKKA